MPAALYLDLVVIESEEEATLLDAASPLLFPVGGPTARHTSTISKVSALHTNFLRNKYSEGDGKNSIFNASAFAASQLAAYRRLRSVFITEDNDARLVWTPYGVSLEFMSMIASTPRNGVSSLSGTPRGQSSRSISVSGTSGHTVHMPALRMPSMRVARVRPCAGIALDHSLGVAVSCIAVAPSQVIGQKRTAPEVGVAVVEAREGIEGDLLNPSELAWVALAKEDMSRPIANIVEPSELIAKGWLSHKIKKHTVEFERDPFFGRLAVRDADVVAACEKMTIDLHQGREAVDALKQRAARRPCTALPTERERVAAIMAVKQAHIQSLSNEVPVDPCEQLTVTICDLSTDAERRALRWQSLALAPHKVAFAELDDADDAIIYPVSISVYVSGINAPPRQYILFATRLLPWHLVAVAFAGEGDLHKAALTITGFDSLIRDCTVQSRLRPYVPPRMPAGAGAVRLSEQASAQMAGAVKNGGRGSNTPLTAREMKPAELVSQPKEVPSKKHTESKSAFSTFNDEVRDRLGVPRRSRLVLPAQREAAERRKHLHARVLERTRAAEAAQPKQNVVSAASLALGTSSQKPTVLVEPRYRSMQAATLRGLGGAVDVVPDTPLGDVLPPVLQLSPYRFVTGVHSAIPAVTQRQRRRQKEEKAKAKEVPPLHLVRSASTSRLPSTTAAPKPPARQLPRINRRNLTRMGRVGTLEQKASRVQPSQHTIASDHVRGLRTAVSADRRPWSARDRTVDRLSDKPIFRPCAPVQLS